MNELEGSSRNMVSSVVLVVSVDAYRKHLPQLTGRLDWLAHKKKVAQLSSLSSSSSERVRRYQPLLNRAFPREAYILREGLYRRLYCCPCATPCVTKRLTAYEKPPASSVNHDVVRRQYSKRY